MALLCILCLAMSGNRLPDCAADEAVLAPGAADGLTGQQWIAVQSSVDRGLQWLATQQLPDGNFEENPTSEPGVTGLCVLAFLSRGHLPGEGPYGARLQRAVDFILASQQDDGLIARSRTKFRSPYCHAIGALVLSEIYGMTRPADNVALSRVIEKAIRFSSRRLPQPKTRPDDAGSWRYLSGGEFSDGDLSSTSWHLMSLRSAKNAGFEVDVRMIDEALAYMRRSYDPLRQTFRYSIHTDNPAVNHTRAMAGAGMLSLSMAGEHQTQMARNTAQFILDRPFDQFDRPVNGEEYQVYGAFYCSQGMFQLGATYWRSFYPTLVETLTKAQFPDGHWRPRFGKDLKFGEAYITALSILALSPPFQMLPIFQP